MKRTKIAPTLAERVKTPEFAAAVKRQRAKLDAQDEGWVVMDPKRARALVAVAQAAERQREEHFAYSMAPPETRRLQPLVDAENATARALARLRRLSAPERDAGKRATRKGATR